MDYPKSCLHTRTMRLSSVCVQPANQPTAVMRWAYSWQLTEPVRWMASGILQLSSYKVAWIWYIHTCVHRCSMERLWCSYWWALFDASATVRNWIGFFSPRAADEFLSPILLAYVEEERWSGQSFDTVDRFSIGCLPVETNMSWWIIYCWLGCWSWNWDV